MRCGYEVNSLVAVDESKKNKSDEPETKVIDPSDVYLSSGDDEPDDGFYDPFGALFDDLFDPIGDILGLFGFGVPNSRGAGRGSSERESKKKSSDKDNKVVEVRDVEILDENGDPVKGNRAHGKHTGKKHRD